MGQFLNNKEPYDKFKTVMNGTYFVDKSEWIKNKKIRMHQVFRSMRIFYSIGETRRKSREK